MFPVLWARRWSSRDSRVRAGRSAAAVGLALCLSLAPLAAPAAPTGASTASRPVVGAGSSAPASTTAPPAANRPAPAVDPVRADRDDWTRPLSWQDALAELTARNPDLASARSGLDAAAADRLRAAARPNASVGLSDTGWRSNASMLRRGDVVLHLEQTFERGDKRRLRIEAADAAAEATRAGIDDVAREQRLRLAEVFVDTAAARERVDIGTRVVETFRRAAEVAQRRVSAGDLAPTDAARARGDLVRAESEQLLARRDLDEARVRLAALLGRTPVGALPDADIATLPQIDPLAGAAVDDRIDARADVRAAHARVDAARRTVAVASSLRSRDVTVGVQVERAPGIAGPVMGVGVSVPLFNGNDYSGDRARALADVATAELELARVRASAHAETRRLALALDAADARRRRFDEEVLPLAQRVADAAQFAFARGAASVLEVLDAQRSLRTAQLDALAARADRQHASAALALQADPLPVAPPAVPRPLSMDSVK